MAAEWPSPEACELAPERRRPLKAIPFLQHHSQPRFPQFQPGSAPGRLQERCDGKLINRPEAASATLSKPRVSGVQPRPSVLRSSPARPPRRRGQLGVEGSCRACGSGKAVEIGSRRAIRTPRLGPLPTGTADANPCGCLANPVIEGRSPELQSAEAGAAALTIGYCRFSWLQSRPSAAVARRRMPGIPNPASGGMNSGILSGLEASGLALDFSTAIYLALWTHARFGPRSRKLLALPPGVGRCWDLPTAFRCWTSLACYPGP